MSPDGSMTRRLGTADAVVIGLGSMIGAGIFASFAPAAAAAGNGLLVGLVVAGGIAFCNATSSAQLAARYPVSGGTYVYGRERLGEWWGFLAGWSFVIGKAASCAAMAMTFAAYAAPDGWSRPVGAAVVIVLAAVNSAGVTRTVWMTRVVVVLVLAVLTLVVLAGLVGRPPAGRDSDGGLFASGPHGILQSAGLLFFAFAGYARIATMGEEVKDPRRTIPKAISRALAITVGIYAAVAAVSLVALGPRRLASSAAPLVDVATVGGWDWAAPLVRIGAAAAALGALLALGAGVSRTILAMARNADLPRPLAAVHPRHDVPLRAELTLAVVVSALVLTMDLRGAIGFSSFGVLVYYVIANIAALTQQGGDRRYPRALQLVGAAGCVVLACALPTTSVVGGLAVLLSGVAYRVTRRGLGSSAAARGSRGPARPPRRGSRS